MSYSKSGVGGQEDESVRRMAAKLVPIFLFCISFHQEVESVSPPRESGMIGPVTCFDQWETVDVMLRAIRAFRALAALSSPCCGPGITGRSSNSLMTDENVCEETGFPASSRWLPSSRRKREAVSWKTSPLKDSPAAAHPPEKKNMP